MNNDGEKKYQDDFQVPASVTIGSENKQSEGYNDTYYDQSYSDNKYNEYEEPKKKFPWKVIVIVVLAIIFILLFWYFLFGRGSGANVNIQYEKLSDELCEKAISYSEKKDGTIDKETPGNTAYVSLQDLVDDYSIPSTAIKDPRYKKTLFTKPEGKEFISFNSYLRLFVMPNGQVSCEGLVDTGDDFTKPMLTLKGTTPVKIAKGTNFTDPGAKAVDDVDGDVTDKILRTGNVDTMTVGEYKITYSVSDTSGNVATKDRLVIVEEYSDIEITLGSNYDLITPQIELKGSNPHCLVLGQKYKEPGAIATDNIDGNITNRIKVDSSAVTGERNGSFRVTYEVSDTYGHRAIAYRSVMVRSECVDKVVVGEPSLNTRPVIQLEGGTSVTINIHENYIDRGATAWDKEDGVLKVVLISNTVNTGKAGIYEVIYRATDSGGLSAQAKRIVTVKDPSAISNVATYLEIPQNLRIPLGQAQVIPKPQAKDSYGNMLTVSETIKDSSEAIVGSINFYRVETYRVEYFAKPNNGVGQSTNRNVTIYDDVAPTITLPEKIFVPVRTSGCTLTITDLKAAGMIVSDSPNEVLPEVIITGGLDKMCALNSNGIDIEVYAQDASGNKSVVKKAKLYVVDKVDGGNPTAVQIIGCENGELNMLVGDVKILTAQIYPVNANDQALSWNSQLSQYATVDDSGKVTAIAKGSTKIMVSAAKGALTSSCNVIVREKGDKVPVSGVDIEGCESGTMTLIKGTSKTLVAIVKPTNASNKNVNWDFGRLTSVIYPKCSNIDMDFSLVRSTCKAGVWDQDYVSKCVSIVEKCVGGSPIIIATEIGEKTIKVTTEDGIITKSCNVKVIEGNQDTTPSSKVIVTKNNANTADPYNKEGIWFGGDLGRKIKIEVESFDAESKIDKFEVRQYLNSSRVDSFIVTPEASNPNKGIIYLDKSMSVELEIVAINEAGLISAASDRVIVKLDNDGPSTTFVTWIENPDSWVSEKNITVKYVSTDNKSEPEFIGIGVKEYQYTHDDVKAKEAKDIKIEDTIGTVEVTFAESNLNRYVYVRAIDKLGNVGPWTEKPSYLNMDTVPPKPTTLSILENSNNTSNVKILFGFEDNHSPKISGFGKYEYYLNAGTSSTKTTETDPLVLTTPGSYTITAYSFDKAGNKSTSPGTLSGITVTAPPAQPTPEPTPTPTPEPPKPPKPPTPPTPPTPPAVPTISAGCPTVDAGKTGKVTVAATGYKTETYRGFTIADDRIASIDQSGNVTGTGQNGGTTQVTVTVKGIPNGGTTEVSKYTTCIVTVRATPTPPPPVTPKTCINYTNVYASGYCSGNSGSVGDASYVRCKYAYQQKVINGSGTKTSNYVYSSSSEAWTACGKNNTSGYECSSTPVRKYTFTCSQWQ